MTAPSGWDVLPSSSSAETGDTDTHWLTPGAGGAGGELPSWAPEHQLVGALMWLGAGAVSRIAAAVPAAAIESPLTRWAYEIIIGLAATGCKPDPVVVLAAARRQPCPIATHPDASPSATRHHQLSIYLARAYTETLCVANAGDYAREVLDNAYRRAFAACGQRMQVLADSDTDRAELTAYFAAARNELADWWRRAEAVTHPGWANP